MAELIPQPFAALVRRMHREWQERRTIFDLPERSFFRGKPGIDVAVRFHGRRAATPFGPAAGPQSQMAQNIVLSWLGGARIIELKTVQVNDRLQIPRPCIDMQTVGYNVEWSQELRLAESLAEYVKGAMLVEIAAALLDRDGVGIPDHLRDTIYDMSVGYDLAGIRSAEVLAFIAGLRAPRRLVERFRAEIPGELSFLRDLDYPTVLADTLTLSTFHGCPPGEIERIANFLLEELALHTVVKLNPLLLGPHDTREILRTRLGYDDIHVPDSAFARDTTWAQAIEISARLSARATALGLGFGVKFTNTLIVENHRSFFPAEQREMYLSGPPLHVLAIELVRRFRRVFGTRIPISFSAGVERRNFADCAALGLVPITACSDLLKPGGYARSKGYFDELAQAMTLAGVDDLRGWTRTRGGVNDHDLAVLAATERYADSLVDDQRYARAANEKVPRKIGRRLQLFECITCDKCIPVCPNDANFALRIPAGRFPRVRLVPAENGRFAVHREGETELLEKHQIANFADFCNDCGNCDVFCPEDGGPYAVKPRFFGSVEAWQRSAPLEGFCLEQHRENDFTIHARNAGCTTSLERDHRGVRYRGDGFDIRLDATLAPESASGHAAGDVDLGWAHLLLAIAEAVLGGANAVSAAAAR